MVLLELFSSQCYFLRFKKNFYPDIEFTELKLLKKKNNVNLFLKLKDLILDT